MVNLMLTKTTTNCLMVIHDTQLDFHPLSVEVPVASSSISASFRKLGKNIYVQMKICSLDLNSFWAPRFVP